MLYKILKDLDSFDFKNFPVLDEVFHSLTEDEVSELINILSKVNHNALYKGLVHGQYHSEKVLMYVYLLCKERGVVEPYRQIMFDAALYHDIGRIDDREEPLHGYASARKILNVVGNNSIYEDKYNQLLIRSIVDSHSQKDSNSTNTFYNYVYDLDLQDNVEELKEIEPLFIELDKILKDSDALDRKRFGDAGFESLNPRYLRILESHDLIGFAEELNAFYYELMKAEYKDVDESHIQPAPCVHSVGFDFFKINSVLTHGILSQDEMRKRQLKVPRNFAGGNFDRWISVVDIRLLKLSATGSKEFVERGVTFICEQVKMHEPSPAHDMTEAIVTGMPWNKSNHADERYVKNRIAPENIIAINIPSHFINKSILDTMRIGDEEHDAWCMRYLYNSLDIKMIKQRLNYYKNKTQTSDNSQYWQDILKYLAYYEEVLNDRDKYGRNGIAKKLTPILEVLNGLVAKMLYIYYYTRIGSGGKDITVLDVVNYELSLNKTIAYTCCETSDGMTYFLAQNQKKIDFKQL